MSDRYTLNITIPADEEGMIGRECPQPKCEKYFKIKPGTGILDNPAMFCPYCQYEGTPDQFFTKEQIEYAKSIALRHFADKIHGEFKKLERRSFKGKFFSMKITAKRGTPPPIRHYLERQLQEKICCENCACEYAIYGVFAICPDCGVQNLFQVLNSNLELIKRQVSLEQRLYSEFGEQFEAELNEIVGGVGQKLVEDACENAVTVFETFFKELNQRYQAKAIDPAKHFSGNLFQRLDGTRDWFLEQFDFDSFAGLEGPEIESLYLLFNKRHILTHNLGIIDEKYLAKTGMRQNLLNHKVDVSVDEVIAAIDAIKKVVDQAKHKFAPGS